MPALSEEFFTQDELATLVADAAEFQREADAFAAWCQTPEAKTELAETARQMEIAWDKLEKDCKAGKFSLSPAEVEQLVRNGALTKCHSIKSDRWADLPQLRKNGQRVLRWIQRSGVVVCWDPVPRKTVAQYLLPVFQALREAIHPLPLVCIYLYRQAEQPPGLQTGSGTPMRDVDGIQWTDATLDRGKLFAIGISVEALERGQEYIQFLFMHEMAHIFSGGEHTEEFHQCLDGLIEQVNKYTGGYIVNDYCK